MRVLRGDIIVEIAAKDIQVGDILYLTEDEEIPADCVVLYSSNPNGFRQPTLMARPISNCGQQLHLHNLSYRTTRVQKKWERNYLLSIFQSSVLFPIVTFISSPLCIHFHGI